MNIVTKHAKQRMKERCGFNKQTCNRMAKKAFEEGVTHAQTKGRLNKWVTSLYFRNKSANNIRLYGDNAYIFCEDRLVTVIPIPNNLKKSMKEMIKGEGRK